MIDPRSLNHRKQFFAGVFHHALGYFRGARELIEGARHALHDLAQHAVVEDPAARTITRDRATLSPRGETAQQGLSTFIPSRDTFEALPSTIRVDLQHGGILQRELIFLEPSATSQAIDIDQQCFAQG